MTIDPNPPEPYFLATGRVGFRVWAPDDLPLATQLWGDPRVTRFITATGQLTDEQIRERLDKELASFLAHGIQYWPLFAREGGTFLGCCGLRPYKIGAGVCELGFHLCSAFWGKGYATEAAGGAVAHAFDHFQLRALFAGHHPDNVASRRVLEKLGFRYTHDELCPPTGLQHPSYHLTCEMFEKLRRA